MNRAHLSEIVDSAGRPCKIGIELGRGGEGAVYELANDNARVAKVYHSPLSAERAEKIRVMSQVSDGSIEKLTAWPIELLARRSGEPIGLLMPKISGRLDIHRLYSPKSRRDDFQRADWRFITRVAANTARAFAAVHSIGCIIGDVNHGSILVGQDATVRLIDCDSFQVVTRARKFLCEVGVETFTPPELQGRPFKGVVRTENHDNFGLAVMIFLLLMMGRHPFAGRFLGKGDMPIPKAIEQYRFAYGVRRADVNMERPPGTPPLTILGDDIAMMFELAFSPQLKSGGRPSAKEWATALQKFEGGLKQCAASSAHWYHHSTAQCPWCQMEGATGVPLFPLIVQGEVGAGLGIDRLWAEIERIPHPGSAPGLAERSVSPTSEARSVGQSRYTSNMVAGIAAVLMIGAGLGGYAKGLSGVLIFGGIAAFFLLKNLLNKSGDVGTYRASWNAAKTKWDNARAEWERRAGPGEFDLKKSALADLRREFLNLPTLRLRKLDQLKRDVRASQLERFLDGYEIERAKIDGIGPGRKKTLESYGIETAADVVRARVAAVPGFGPKLQGQLQAWRQELEARFVFDPKRGVDPRDVTKVEQEIINARTKIESQLRIGLGELRQISQQIANTRLHMRGTIEAVQQEFAQAQANYNAATGN